MNKLFIYDPSERDPVSKTRGGGRMVQILRENFPEATFSSDLTEFTESTDSRSAGAESILLIPFFKPFEAPILTKRIADKQFLMIYDTIPLKYPAHFPAGLKGTLNLWRNKRALRHFDGIITISEASKQDIHQFLGVDKNKIHVVYPTTSRIFFKNATNSESKIQSSKLIQNSKLNSQFSILHSKFCVYTGDVNWNKNLVTLARAVKKAGITCIFVGKNFHELKNEKGEMRDKKNLSNFKFKISNSSHPWQREFQNFLKEAKNSKQFIFLGQVNDQELIQLYEQSVCNIIVSFDEGFGLSYLEASLRHCPSVLSDISVFREVAEGTALYAQSDSIDEIAGTIKKYFDNDKLRSEIAEKAHFRASKLYSPEIFKKSLERILL